MSEPMLAVWRARGFRFAAGSASVAVLALAGIARNKWLALHLDTAGMGVAAQVVAVQAWIGVAAALGLGLPLTRAVGAALGRGDPAGVRRAVATALALVAAACAVLGTAAIAAAPALAGLVLGSPAHAGLVRVAALGGAGYALYALMLAYFAGRSDVRAPLTLAIAGGAVTVVLALLLVHGPNLMGAAVSSAALFPAALVAGLVVHRRPLAGALTPVPGAGFDAAEARTMLSVAAAALALALTDQGTMLTLRTHVLHVHGQHVNGLLQAALAIPQQVGAPFYAYLSGYAFGMISGVGGPKGVERYTRKQWPPFLALALIVFALALLAAAPLLHLLYSDRFDPARRMMAWGLLGEFAKVSMLAWTLGSLIVGGAGLWLALGLAYDAALLVGYALAARLGAGEMAMPLAYAGAGVAVLAVGAAAMARRGVRPRPRDVLAALAALAILTSLAVRVAR